MLKFKKFLFLKTIMVRIVCKSGKKNVFLEINLKVFKTRQKPRFDCLSIQSVFKSRKRPAGLIGSVTTGAVVPTIHFTGIGRVLNGRQKTLVL